MVFFSSGKKGGAEDWILEPQGSSLKIEAKKFSLADFKGDVLVVPVSKDGKLSQYSSELKLALGLPDIDQQKVGEEGLFTSTFVEGQTFSRVVYVGVGEQAKVDVEKVRKLGGKVVKYLQMNQLKQAIVLSCSSLLSSSSNVSEAEVASAFTEGVVLGMYAFERYKTDEEAKKKKQLVSVVFVPEERSASALSHVQKALETSKTLGVHTNFVRDLVNLPANVATPSYLASLALRVAKASRLKCTILGRKDLEKEKMGCFLSVAQGSAEEPQLVVLEYHAKKKNAPTYAFVGKGVTFDTGGYNIKQTGYMETMYTDKAGAMVVLGTVKAAAELSLDVNVIGILGLTENMISGSASKPSDIVTASNGKTVEIGNTDAEGRLVLSDCLHYATRFKPTAIFDVATLTGAAYVALGPSFSAMLGNDSKLMERFSAAGQHVYERVWQLPLLDEFDEYIKSDVADLKNISNLKGGAGTIVGAVFLKNFVGKYPWVHFDIAATARSELPTDYLPKGATGVGVRLFVEFLRQK